MFNNSQRSFSRPSSRFGSSRPGQRSSGNFRSQGRSFGGGRRQKSFDPSMFVKKAVEEVVEAPYVSTLQFTDFEINDQLKQNIIDRGYLTPTPIQDQAMPHVLEGRDVIGIANTGTGKTAAFLIPMINKICYNRDSKVLIVAPTRELAVQIQDEFKEFAKGMKIYSALCIGGVGIGGQIQALSRNPQFVIGTPGRLRDLEQQRQFEFNYFDNIILDEVDRMLDMGFIGDVKYITANLPEVRQSLFFSATLPDRVKELMRGFLRDPITVSVKSRESAANVDQDIIKLAGKSKIDVLHELLQKEGWDKVLVFGRTKHGMEKLSQALYSRGFNVAAIHGNKNQNQRQKALEMFKSDRVQILLATDIASRGLDINSITHVINYDLPESYEDYIHRIGRTGRANKKGFAVTFVD